MYRLYGIVVKFHKYDHGLVPPAFTAFTSQKYWVLSASPVSDALLPVKPDWLDTVNQETSNSKQNFKELDPRD